MAASALLVTSICLCLSGEASAQETLVDSPAIRAILESVFPEREFIPTRGPNVRALVGGDVCTEGATLQIEDNNFDSTGCYVDTAIGDGVAGFMYTETGVEPTQGDITGWDQAVTFAISVFPSTSSSSSSQVSSTSTPIAVATASAEFFSEGSSIGHKTTDDYIVYVDGGNIGDRTTNDDSNGDDDYSGDNYYTSDECREAWKADGECDYNNNSPGCDYDGGDCCECTCVDSEYNCGEGVGFACIDPSASCVDDTGIGLPLFNHTPSATEMFWISTYLPRFDGQPLVLARMTYICLSSSVEIGTHPANAASWSCATLTESSSGTSAVFEEMPEWRFSTDCGCKATEIVSTNEDDYTTLRDDVTDIDDSDTTATPTGASSTSSTSSSSIGCEDASWKADGMCDSGNNNAECEFDGGDCCECTCVDTVDITCGNFNCIDSASASCVDNDDGDSLPTKGGDSPADSAASSAYRRTASSALGLFATALSARAVTAALGDPYALVFGHGRYNTVRHRR